MVKVIFKPVFISGTHCSSETVKVKLIYSFLFALSVNPP